MTPSIPSSDQPLRIDTLVAADTWFSDQMLLAQPTAFDATNSDFAGIMISVPHASLSPAPTIYLKKVWKATVCASVFSGNLDHRTDTVYLGGIARIGENDSPTRPIRKALCGNI